MVRFGVRKGARGGGAKGAGVGAAAAGAAFSESEDVVVVSWSGAGVWASCPTGAGAGAAVVVLGLPGCGALLSSASDIDSSGSEESSGSSTLLKSAQIQPRGFSSRISPHSWRSFMPLPARKIMRVGV